MYTFIGMICLPGRKETVLLICWLDRNLFRLFRLSQSGNRIVGEEVWLLPC